MHPSIHLEIARQRHQDLLAEAERQRAARPFDQAGGTPRARPTAAAGEWLADRIHRNRHDPDVEVGLEV